MRGAWLTRGAVATVLLFGGPSVCLADGKYDRSLERATMEIVARKMGDIRGTLEREWTPPAAFSSLDAVPQQTTSLSGTGSILTVEPPAVADSSANRATRIIRN